MQSLAQRLGSSRELELSIKCAEQINRSRKEPKMIKMRHSFLFVLAFVFFVAGCASSSGSRSPSSSKSYDCSAQDGKFMVDCR